MVNQEILGGLKSALARGESLKIAMSTFYNSGYKREEIEEAARELQSQPQEEIQKEQVKQIIQQKPKLFSFLFRKQPKQALSVPKPQQTQPQPLKTTQKVSEYGQKKDRFMIILLITILVVLSGLLALIFVFKDELISLFGNLFS